MFFPTHCPICSSELIVEENHPTVIRLYCPKFGGANISEYIVRICDSSIMSESFRIGNFKIINTPLYGPKPIVEIFNLNKYIRMYHEYIPPTTSLNRIKLILLMD